MSALLEVSRVSKRFGGLQAVDRLSLTVNEGEILGLIGPNGAGKSTVFNLINGVYPPDTGKVVFAGEDITGGPPYRVAHQGIARAHQIVQPLGGLSVLDNCTVGACFGREALALARGARSGAARWWNTIGLGDRPDMLAGLAHHRRQEAAGTGARLVGAPAPAAAGRGAGRAQSDRNRGHDRDRAQDSRKRYRNPDDRAHHAGGHEPVGPHRRAQSRSRSSRKARRSRLPTILTSLPPISAIPSCSA